MVVDDGAVLTFQEFLAATTKVWNISRYFIAGFVGVATP